MTTPDTIVPIPWSLKILLVDDIDTNLAIIKQMLESLNQQVIAVESGHAALEQGKQHVFDLVLLDMQMPGLNGCQTLQQWRSSPDILDPDCPVFAFTSSPAALLDAQFTQAIAKPVTLAQLNTALRQAADLQRDREIQLTRNNEGLAPIVDLSQVELVEKLASHLFEMSEQAKMHIQHAAWSQLAETLHTIKGSAGMAGMLVITQEAARLETLLETHHQLTLAQIAPLCRMILSI